MTCRPICVPLILTFVVFPIGSGFALAQHAELERLKAATTVFEEIMEAPDNAVPRAILERAEAIAIIPNTVKAGFIFGGHRGKGVLSARNEQGAWSQPAFLTLTGGSFGLQIGGQAIDLVLVVMNRRGLEKLIQNEFKFGGDVSAVIGPVGRDAEATTDLHFRAEIISYSRTRGLFAGITLKGSTITADRDANERFYGYPYGSGQLVLEEEPATPEDSAAVTAWRTLLSQEATLATDTAP
ncbi:MAG: lipid-binding SYLF domain-containing protein [Acidobacteriota bacterium]|nr:lipid-binding SYLF domain-containing protein [Acidobacteriota bacterium]